MQVAIMKAVVTLMLASLGITQVWCESCGEMYASYQMSTCHNCDALVCPVCVELYGYDDGCFVCDGKTNIDCVNYVNYTSVCTMQQHL